MMLKSGTGQNFLITANSLKHQRKLGTNIVVIKRVDCTMSTGEPPNIAQPRTLHSSQNAVSVNY